MQNEDCFFFQVLKLVNLKLECLFIVALKQLYLGKSQASLSCPHQDLQVFPSYTINHLQKVLKPTSEKRSNLLYLFLEETESSRDRLKLGLRAVIFEVFISPPWGLVFCTWWIPAGIFRECKLRTDRRDSNPGPPCREDRVWTVETLDCWSWSVECLNRLYILLVGRSLRDSFLHGASPSRPDYCWVQRFCCCTLAPAGGSSEASCPPSFITPFTVNELSSLLPSFLLFFFKPNYGSRWNFAVNLYPKSASLVPSSPLFPCYPLPCIGSASSSSPPGDLSVPAHVDGF